MVRGLSTETIEKAPVIGLQWNSHSSVNLWLFFIVVGKGKWNRGGYVE